ncbi:1,6-anhydro-N-acetylmuramyl-L-alanine amidase AmpD [Neptuniibacter caesariensis]|uniref:1,6-anhydro-N-acetylmuramyl-L-alanine amidase AmpD n=1 Tax=Neptuniibacter caesariensis TaxID=207954 RepID=A0A7U8C227_NEPCE|nr:1,6-anhydro-N-acetylmuramyl-L-alanine amidase AmpD [Neptuniibacter caesariensis]EAR59461.1 N-acetylmuramoyl-L-alanine amidase, family 2 [Oceanospirillum sp. MED92] [Neptuniibacter caesariensis]
MANKDEQIWQQGVEVVPSPNFNERPVDSDISLLVIHNISLPPKQYGGGYIQQFFQNKLPVDDHPFFSEIKNLKVSAHLLVERDGTVTQFVPLSKRAWHAGVSEYEGREACNDFSIGIELEGCDDDTFTEQQYRALVRLTREIRHQYPAITEERITGHSDIAPGRKTDPGPGFDWEKYFDALGVSK